MRTRSRAPTRTLILEEVKRLIAAKGVDSFTLNDVARPLCVKAPAIYKHFASRDDVLNELARLYIDELARQFALPTDMRNPASRLREALDSFVDFHLENPAYVRLSFVDLATPGGGVDYMQSAAGGSFQDNFRSGPLAPMHDRLDEFMKAGWNARQFRRVQAKDFYRLIVGVLLIHLVFPDDEVLTARTDIGDAAVKSALWDIVDRYLRRESNARRKVRPRSTARSRSRGA
jgi:AcrR family transcriptional regulator